MSFLSHHVGFKTSDVMGWNDKFAEAIASRRDANLHRIATYRNLEECRIATTVRQMRLSLGRHLSLSGVIWVVPVRAIKLTTGRLRSFRLPVVFLFEHTFDLLGGRK